MRTARTVACLPDLFQNTLMSKAASSRVLRARGAWGGCRRRRGSHPAGWITLAGTCAQAGSLGECVEQDNRGGGHPAVGADGCGQGPAQPVIIDGNG